MPQGKKGLDLEQWLWYIVLVHSSRRSFWLFTASVWILSSSPDLILDKLDDHPRHSPARRPGYTTAWLIRRHHSLATPPAGSGWGSTTCCCRSVVVAAGPRHQTATRPLQSKKRVNKQIYLRILLENQWHVPTLDCGEYLANINKLSGFRLCSITKEKKT